MNIIERLSRVMHEEEGGGDADELMHHPAQASWEDPIQPRWQQWQHIVMTLLRDLHKQGNLILTPEDVAAMAAYEAENADEDDSETSCTDGDPDG